MSLEVTLSGAAMLHKVAAQIRDEGRKDLSRQMSVALGKAVEPLKVSITREAAAAMPSGYTDLLTGSLQHRMSRRNGGQMAQVTLRTHADGKKERRDLPSLEDGVLRHPLFGRKKKWYVTRVRAGFHKRGTEMAADNAVEALGQVVDRFAAKLIE